MSIESSVVLITGASEGIGAASAHLLRQRGAKLALLARSEEKLKSVAREGDLVLPIDLTDIEARSQAIRQVIGRFGRIDILINNAGAGLYAPSHTADMRETRRMIELNLIAPLDLIQQAAPHMKRQRSGMIVNVGSIAGKVTLPWFTMYSASKYALGSLTDGLRMELRSHGIHTMTVCPGYVNTRFQQNVLQGEPPALAGAARKWAISPEQCAQAMIRGIDKKSRTVVTPASGWLLIVAERLFPNIVDRQLEKIYLRQHTT